MPGSTELVEAGPHVRMAGPAFLADGNRDSRTVRLREHELIPNVLLSNVVDPSTTDYVHIPAFVSAGADLTPPKTSMVHVRERQPRHTTARPSYPREALKRALYRLYSAVIGETDST